MATCEKSMRWAMACTERQNVLEPLITLHDSKSLHRFPKFDFTPRISNSVKCSSHGKLTKTVERFRKPLETVPFDVAWSLPLCALSLVFLLGRECKHFQAGIEQKS